MVVPRYLRKVVSSHKAQVVVAFIAVFVVAASAFASPVKSPKQASIAPRSAKESANASALSASTTAVASPVADASVVKARPTTNYGTNTRIDADSPGEAAYIRFSVNGAPGVAQRATLRFYVRNGSTNGPSLFRTSSAWTEAGITWDDRPAATSVAIADLGAVRAGTWAEYDVTKEVTGDGTYDFILLPDSTDGVQFQSREGSSSPQLVLDFAASGDSTPTTTTTTTTSTTRAGSQDTSTTTTTSTTRAVTTTSASPNTTATTTTGATPTTSATTRPTTTRPPSSCLDRASKTVLTGIQTQRISISSPPDSHTIDARTAVSLTSGVRALEVGSSRAPVDLCVVGWTTIGQQSRTLSWRAMHDDVGGSALRVYGSNYVVDGLRAENVEDGFDPRGGEGFELRNAWMSYVRDDCIEDDERRAGKVVDSLFEGCYTFFSEQEAGTVAGESLTFENVLARLAPLPAPRGSEDPNVLGHGSFFKKFDDGGRHQPIIRDSVFFLDGDCYSGCHDWPAGTTASNVVIVWTGAGQFPMSVLPGMTLTTDRSVWDAAAAKWKARHGCTTIAQACTKLTNPDPL